MSFLAYPDGTPVFGSSCPINTKAAERQASRTLGADWRERGYRVCYGEPRKREFTVPIKNPRTTIRIGGNPTYGWLTDWHAV